MTPLFYEDSLGAKAVEAWESLGSADDELIDDPAELAAAQAEVNGEDPEAVYADVTPQWVAVFGPSKLSGIADVAGANACVITMPLEAAGISFAWDPYPPEEMPGAAYPSEHVADRPFTLLVAPADADRARLAITASPGAPTPVGAPSSHDREPDAVNKRLTLGWALFLAFIGPSALLALSGGAYAIYHLLRYGHL